MVRPAVVKLFGVAESWQQKAWTHVVVSVDAEEYVTFYKLRMPDEPEARGLALRAFDHSRYIHKYFGKRRAYSLNRASHMLSPKAAVEEYLRRTVSEVDSAVETLAEKRASLRKARKALAEYR